MFCRYYVQNGTNGTNAAISAGYSKKTAGQIAEQNLKKLEIKQYISELLKPTIEKLEISKERVLEEIARLAFSNPQDYLNSNNSIKDITEIDRSKAAAVSKIKTTVRNLGDFGTEEKTEIEFWNKVEALKKLGEYLKLFDGEGSKATVVNTINLTDDQINKIVNG